MKILGRDGIFDLRVSGCFYVSFFLLLFGVVVLFRFVV